ncbi:hypothetical protein ACI7RC_04045 [Brevibacillus sp. B_LB10_24]|uniref:hypothetical protein n=1 Tax=Brevibacillus sp. B_LB10_24 TaxID=3380645 RepID=UPI0038BDABC6
MEGLFSFLFLCFIGLLILYLTIQWAIDHSQMKAEISEIKEILLKLQPPHPSENHPDSSLLSDKNTGESCPGCGSKVTGQESACPSCGLRLADEQ